MKQFTSSAVCLNLISSLIFLTIMECELHRTSVGFPPPALDFWVTWHPFQKHALKVFHNGGNADIRDTIEQIFNNQVSFKDATMAWNGFNSGKVFERNRCCIHCRTAHRKVGMKRFTVTSCRKNSNWISYILYYFILYIQLFDRRKVFAVS